MGDTKSNRKHESESRELDTLRDEVFSNPVVWRNLGQFLNFGDLKACRLVSMQFNRQVMDSTGFKRWGRVELSCKHLKKHVFGTTKEKWRNLSLPVCYCRHSRNLGWLYPMLEAVEYLSLQSRCRRGHEQIIPASFEHLLRAPKEGQLRHLCLLPLTLTRKGAGKALRAARDVLSKITELELGPFDRRFPFLWVDESNLRELISGIKNLRLFNAVGFVHGEIEDGSLKRILRIAEKNRNGLRILRLDKVHEASMDSTFSGIFGKETAYPALKELGLSAFNFEVGKLSKLFESQIFLSLEVLCLNGLSSSDLVNLLRAIGSKGSRLRSVEIFSDGIKEPNSLLFESLGCLQELHNFVLHVGSCDDEARVTGFSMAHILNNLPASVSQISLSSYRWTFSSSLKSSHFTQFIDTDKLTVLVLSGRRSGVTDKTAQFICRKLRMLQKLDLSYGECTDYGLTGIHPGRSVASSKFCLTALKGLRSLTLYGCRRITDQTLRIAICFLELKHLDLGGKRGQLTPEGFRTVIQQNPSLETLKYGTYLKRVMRPLREFRGPRLRSLYPDEEEEGTTTEESGDEEGGEEEDRNVSHEEEEEEEDDDEKD